MSNRELNPSRRHRQNKACSRCRRRKIRCDLQYPICGSCSKAGVECLGYDAIQRVDKPRGATVHLEEEIARLENELSRVKKQTRTPSDIANATAEGLSTAVARNIVHPRGSFSKHDTDKLPLSSPFFLSSSPMPHLKFQIPPEATFKYTWEQSPHAINASSVPRHVVDAMLKHYCEIYRPQYPAIEEIDLYEACDRVYTNSQPSDADVFYVHITLAISTNTLTHENEARAIKATHGFWMKAVDHLPRVGLSDPWERLQALHLLTHYGCLNPTDVDCFRCAEAASRLSVNLGLHHELPASATTKLDNTTLNVRRRLFWHSYSMDSAVNVTRCQPFLFPTSVITAKFPDFDSKALPTRHVWLLRQIESEITVSLYYPSYRIEGPLSNAFFDEWFEGMHERLDEWYSMIAQSSDLSNTLEFHELHYSLQILRLNRPSPRFPTPTGEMHQRALKAAASLIRKFSVLDRTGKLFYLWHAAHIIIESGICLLACIMTGMESTRRDQTPLAGEDLSTLNKYITAIPFLVGRVSRRWPNIAGHTSALENICLQVLQKLQQWSDGGTIEKSSFDDLKYRLNNLTLFPSLPLNSQPTFVENNDVSQPSPILKDDSTQIPPTTHKDTVRQPPENGYGITSTTNEINPEYLDPVTTTFLSDRPSLFASGVEVSTADPDFFNTAWMDSQLFDPIQGHSAKFSDMHDLDTETDALWDFAGMDSEQIISALLDTENNTF
ncbi:hypothetical protein BGW36DRAFT_364345 [Talaromyces proteolyticus]|uniref:Zn(2)-C6 fungal-type domain-containing protein n=1 Tax=Talaromyces proteolyticus TaxID=1131652 RepID=A0AAD4KGU9_9EURO|nr:uncharacterized protein BGW36DRAFT_364345 [Talaromyces proteolyticus]KAH8690783.1 hypothetical protein BGW36DRAFT_364345 [Talaromyces proteolyticus]